MCPIYHIHLKFSNIKTFCLPPAYAIRTEKYGSRVSPGDGKDSDEITLPELQTYAQNVTKVSCLKAYVIMDGSPSKQDAEKEVITIIR